MSAKVVAVVNLDSGKAVQIVIQQDNKHLITSQPYATSGLGLYELWYYINTSLGIDTGDADFDLNSLVGREVQCL